MAAHAKPNIVFIVCDNRSTELASPGTYSVPLPGQGEASLPRGLAGNDRRSHARA